MSSRGNFWEKVHEGTPYLMSTENRLSARRLLIAGMGKARPTLRDHRVSMESVKIFLTAFLTHLPHHLGEGIAPPDRQWVNRRRTATRDSLVSRLTGISPNGLRA